MSTPSSDLCQVCDQPAEPEQPLCRACLETMIARLTGDSEDACDACNGVPEPEQSTWCGRHFDHICLG